MASQSMSALLERNAQLEQQALESEARVAELQVLRASMERRLRVLEQIQLNTAAQREAEARQGPEANVQVARKAPEKKAKAEPARAKTGKRSGRR